ncbi:hypothetical protein H9Q10_06910 [Eikenella sp. S3360]|uniref:Uncharacterized protein n=1 Tax=Eikenella glucosivorans TaxID=2766967 RepID=A0ABS0NAU2_9NEIS|nr:hypothetical protein [Eikenella glucosivorans]MBH5329397.1 hypothetical protein [Eikenella glucosivorans]
MAAYRWNTVCYNMQRNICVTLPFIAVRNIRQFAEGKNISEAHRIETV